MYLRTASVDPWSKTRVRVLKSNDISRPENRRNVIDSWPMMNDRLTNSLTLDPCQPRGTI